MKKNKAGKGYKVSRGSYAAGAVTYVLSTAVLFAAILLMTLINYGGDTNAYLQGNLTEIVLVCVSYCILSGIMYFYFYFENKKYILQASKIIEVFLILLLSLVLTFVIGKFVGSAARPVAFLALMCVTLLGRREAIFVNIIYAMQMFILDNFTEITALNSTESYNFLILTFCAGMVAIFVMPRIKTRIGSVLVAFILLIPIELILALLEVFTADDIGAASIYLLYGALGSFFSVLLYMFFLPIFELIFSELTVFRLRELTSDQAKLIKRMKRVAPGTYHHSMVVAQISESCAQAIGEDSELARAAAYYHDVGKLKNPEMFTENQTDYNLHNELTPELSVDIIRSHARDGAQLIRKAHLPEYFADIAIQHHGTLPIKYFYAKALKMSDGELNIANYSYAGPTPETKISAIIMIADAAEAAARSLSDRSPEKVEELVRNLIEERLDMEQFDHCSITMSELTTIKLTIVSQLTGVYHSRIAYPKLKVSKRH
ncbi:MAG: HDIG domain-containing protein [Clostridia bacterium]|nr:HDIG domain-containing protein [Clostridia bacterium]